MRIFVVLLAVLTMSSEALARSSLTGPLVQLAGLRAPPSMPRAALVHAIRRDAWTGVWLCAHNSNLRGSIRVRLRRAANGAQAELGEPVPAAQRAATQCMLTALARVHLPPLEVEPTAGATVEFELLVRGRRLPGPLLLPPMVVEWSSGPQR